MSNFFRDSSLGFKPRSNIFTKLRVKDTESQNESSNIQEGDSSTEGLFLTSNRDEDVSSITTEINSDTKLAPQFQIGSSTPIVTAKATRIGRGLLDEDDLEITEVRDVAITDGTATVPSKDTTALATNSRSNTLQLPPQKDCDMDASSNDVLLEAFTNTQKICSNLKQELHRVQTENSRLKSQMQNHQNDKEKIIEKFSEYKILLDSFGEKSKALFEQKRKEDLKLKEFKENYEQVLKKVNGYRTDVNDLKSNLSHLKCLKKETDLELARRIKEIEYLKKDLDTCSGQLSEEKLKNSSLVQEFGKIRKGLKDSLTEQFSQGQSLILEKMCSFEQNIIKAHHVELSEISRSSTYQLTECINNTQKSLASEFKFAVTESNTSISGNYQKCHQQLSKQLHQIGKHHEELGIGMREIAELQNTEMKTQKECLLEELSRIHAETSGKLDILLERNQSFAQFFREEMQKGKNGSSEIIQKLLLDQQTFFDEMRKGHKGSTECMKKLFQELLNFKNGLTSCREYEGKIAELHTQVTSLKLQKSQVLSSLGTKEAQYDDVCKTLLLKETEISNFRGLEKELHEKIEAITTETDEQKNKWSRLKEENINLKANSENKLVVQNELLKAFQSENENLKHRTAQLEEMRQHFERENSARLDKIQRTNEQLQKLNVEMVQLKARELELEEENRNLRKSMDDDRSEFEETTDEFKRLRQRVIVLESDKQDIVSEKLDLQDQIERMKNIINSLKQKVAVVKKNEEHHLKRIEMQAAQLYGPEKEMEHHTSRRQGTQRKKIEESVVIMHQPIESMPPTENRAEVKDNEDEFDLSSSLNDDLELTNPSPIKPVTAKRGETKMRPPLGVRKKLLLPDESESAPSKRRWKKRRT